MKIMSVWLSLVKRSSGGRDRKFKSCHSDTQKNAHVSQANMPHFFYIFLINIMNCFLYLKKHHISHTAVFYAVTIHSRYFSKLLQVFDIITIHQSQMTTKFALFIEQILLSATRKNKPCPQLFPSYPAEATMVPFAASIFVPVGSILHTVISCPSSCIKS